MLTRLLALPGRLVGRPGSSRAVPGRLLAAVLGRLQFQAAKPRNEAAASRGVAGLLMLASMATAAAAAAGGSGTEAGSACLPGAAGAAAAGSCWAGVDRRATQLSIAGTDATLPGLMASVLPELMLVLAPPASAAAATSAPPAQSLVLTAGTS